MTAAEGTRKLGHRSKFSAERMAQICEALQLGATRQMACEYAGLHLQTLRDWIADAEEYGETSPYRDVPDMLAQNEAIGNITRLRAIKDAQRFDWRAAAWMLERAPSTKAHYAAIRTGASLSNGDGKFSIEALQTLLLEVQEIEALDEENNLDTVQDEDASMAVMGEH